MHRKQWLFVVLLSTVGCGPAKQTADLVLHNGAIYTMNAAAPKAQSMAIIGGRIVAIGSDEEIARQYRSEGGHRSERTDGIAGISRRARASGVWRHGTGAMRC